jgi:hypothetical protein
MSTVKNVLFLTQEKSDFFMVYHYQPAEMLLLSLQGTAFVISLFLNPPYWKQKQLADIFDTRRTLCGVA